jgi:Flp pilus assembly protein TadD
MLSLHFFSEAARRGDPANAIAHHNLGAALLLLGRRAEAKAESEAALHLRPDPGQARASLEQLDHDR